MDIESMEIELYIVRNWINLLCANYSNKFEEWWPRVNKSKININTVINLIKYCSKYIEKWWIPEVINVIKYRLNTENTNMINDIVLALFQHCSENIDIWLPLFAKYDIPVINAIAEVVKHYEKVKPALTMYFLMNNQ